MAAFVAVADDASAVAWNPSGLVFGPLFNLSIGLGRSTGKTGDVPRFPDAAGERGHVLFALGLPPLGISYVRSTSVGIVADSPAGAGTGGRQDEQVLVRAVTSSSLGATVLQSLGDYITVGGTIRLVRGGAAEVRTTASTWDQGFDAAGRLSTHPTTTLDADIGAMVAAGRYRGGGVLRNVMAPTFGREPGLQTRLRRHGRIGIAWGDRWPGQARTIAAMDADLTRVVDLGGERRDVAAGVERWVWAGRLAVRGGVRASTLGAARPVMSGGVSFAVRAGTFVDGHVGRGQEGRTAWGLAVRVSY